MIRFKKISFAAINKHCLAIAVWGFMAVVPLSAQVQTKMTLSERLVDSEVLNLLELAVDATSTSSSPLFWIEMLNTTSQEVTGLRISVHVSSTQKGDLVSLEQDAPGFNLSPNQRVFVASNEMDNGFPGVEEDINISGEINDFLTKSGRDLYNNAGGILPNDLYTIKFAVIKDGNEIPESISYAYLGVKPQQDAVDFVLLQPGGTVGSSASIVSTNPNFRWDGPRNAEYRLVVVKKNPDSDETSESLIQAALSTDATIDKGLAVSSSLLDFEIVDAIIKGNDFTLPPQGVQKLEQGALYYWQIYYIANTKNGRELRPSTIWEFSIPRPGENAASAELEKEIFNQLAVFISNELATELFNNGFKLLSIEIDNQTVSGPALMKAIEDIKEKFESGKYKF
ncbi:hypothetical protein EP331_14130 [bacterium]|nr:MAG: hypothetical protein EP331_14130 [bacterium]